MTETTLDKISAGGYLPGRGTFPITEVYQCFTRQELLMTKRQISSRHEVQNRSETRHMLALPPSGYNSIETIYMRIVYHCGYACTGPV